MTAASLALVPLADPPVAECCAFCGGERKLPPKRHRLEAAADPFCSSECCRAWYGLPAHTREPQEKRAYV